MNRLALPAAVLLATIAAWLSQATLSIATSDGPRIALLPVSIVALAVSAVVGFAVLALRRAELPLAPIWLLGLIILPWIPIPLPAAALMWSGSLRWLVWFSVALLVIAPLGPRLWRRFRPTSAGSFIALKPQLSAGLLAFILFRWSAWEVSPSIPGGDEPHYLIITQSLLIDRDLKIENNHKRGDYHRYYAGPLAPHYIQRGRNGEIYSIHAPGLSALVAPAFAIAGYPGAVLFLIVLAACGSALAWHVAWLATRQPAAAWFGWAAVTWSATTIFHSFAVYPDGLGGILTLTGVWALIRARQERSSGVTSLRPWFLHGAALALLPWMHSRFALLAGSLGALVLLRLPSTKNPAGKAVAFLAAPATSALAWMTFFLVIYGGIDPAAPYGTGTSREFSIGFVPGGLTGLLFDQRFGLIANAPVLLFAFVGLAMMIRVRQVPNEAAEAVGLADRRLSCELLFVMVPYLITATTYAMWWAGSSAPARFAAPAVLMLAIPCAVAWAGLRDRATRTVAAGALAFTGFLSFVLVTTAGGRLAFNTRETTAIWLDWASRLTSLGEGLPFWYRGREAAFARDVAIWAAALLLAYACARAVAAWPGLRDRARLATTIAAVFAVAAMLALSVVWTLRGAEGLSPAPSQLDLLRRLARAPRVVAAQVAPPKVLDRSTILGLLRIESVPRVAAGGGGMGRSEQPLLSLPNVPAGRYRILTRTRGAGGWLIIGIGQDQFALRSGPLSYPASPIEIDFPVDVRALAVRGDEDARRAIRSIVVEPQAIVGADARLTDGTARRAVKYDRAVVFFLDEACFPEPQAFWVGGARRAVFVVQPLELPRSVSMVLRNAPVENHVIVASGQWREELTLEPGEERQIGIPLAPGASAALVTITTTSGFRPSEAVPGSRDERFLGVWVKPL
jgi:hypothetical protein